MDIRRLYSKAYYPHTEWKLPREFFLKLPATYSFDLEALRDYVDKVIDKVGLTNLKMNDNETIFNVGYKGMGFTHRKNALSPSHDAFRLFNEKGEFDTSSSSKRTMYSLLKDRDKHQFEKNFTEKTEYFTGPIEKALLPFKSLITKVRVVELGPGQKLHEHFDYPFYENVRVHAVLETNENVEWWVEDQMFKIPADGNFYWFDTGRAHQVINSGSSIRRVLSVHLSVYKDKENNLVYGPETDLVDLILESKI